MKKSFIAKAPYPPRVTTKKTKKTGKNFFFSITSSLGPARAPPLPLSVLNTPASLCIQRVQFGAGVHGQVF